MTSTNQNSTSAPFSSSHFSPLIQRISTLEEQLGFPSHCKDEKTEARKGVGSALACW